jgi:simple sugar transport system substrate-binding protein
MSFAYILAVLMVAVAACSGGDHGATSTTSGAPNTGARTTVALITHQAEGDTFWDLVRRGAEAVADLAEAGAR